MLSKSEVNFPLSLVTVTFFFIDKFQITTDDSMKQRRQLHHIEI